MDRISLYFIPTKLDQIRHASIAKKQKCSAVYQELHERWCMEGGAWKALESTDADELRNKTASCGEGDKQ